MSFENPNSTVDATGNRRNHYGPRKMEEARKFGARVSINAAGNVEAEWVFNYDDLPAISASGSMELVIPSSAVIVKSYLQAVEAMTGTSGTLTLGLTEPDATVIDVDGIDVAVAQASLTADAVIINDGALIGTALGAGIEGAQLVATTGGTVTGGRFRVVIEYAEAEVDGAATYVAGGVKGN